VATAEQERAAFLAAILAAPGDDAVRLVFADWLEEHGDVARAEFIRVQVGLAGVERRAGGPKALGLLKWGHPWRLRAKALRRRGRELLGQDIHLCLHCDWHAPVPHGSWEWQYRRGFVDSVACACRSWLARGPAVVAAQPVTRVRLGDQVPYRGPETGPGFAWARKVRGQREGPFGDDHVLPAGLFDALADGRRGTFGTGQPLVLYPSAAEAHDALSAAALAWARGQNLHQPSQDTGVS
jgi:uncharacterized protein (TIGR02996 family)